MPTNKNKRILVFFLIWLFAAGLGTVLRLIPVNSHVSPEAYEKGALLALNNLRGQVRVAVDRQHPELNAEERKQLAIREFDQLIKDETTKVRGAILTAARRIDEELPERKPYPYLLASDSYYYYGLTKRILRDGTVSDSIQGSKYLNRMMLSPHGHMEPLNLHPYLGAGLHRLLRVFFPGIDAMHSVCFMPLILAALTLIPFVAICYSLGFTALVSWAACVNVSLSVVFFERSLFGWYDNDPYSVLFTFTILFFVVLALRKRLDTRTALLNGILCSFLMALYAFFWQGWVFLESILAFSGGLILVHNHFVIKDRPQTKFLALYFLTLLLGSFALIACVFGKSEFFILFQEGWAALSKFVQSDLAMWPDLYIAVGELRKATIVNIVNLTNGVDFLLISLWSVGILCVNAVRKRTDRTSLIGILLLVFLIVTFVMAKGAKRFTLLYLVPLSIIFPFGLQDLFNRVSLALKKLNLEEQQRSFAQSSALVLLSAALVINPVIHLHKNAPSLVRLIYNDVWEKVLTQIKETTPPNSIVNTWWPPGHFITSVAERAVSFDGATINVPQAYWMANVFLSTDERMAAGLLRTLNNGGDKAVDYLESQGFKLSASVNMIKAVSPLSRKEAEETIGGFLNDEQLKTLLDMTHKTPPPTYLLIYNDLIDKNIQLTFVGNWNFKKVEEINNSPAALANIPRGSIKDYVNFLWQLSDGMPRFSGALIPLRENEKIVLFEDGVVLNKETMDVRIKSQKYGEGTPYSLIYLKDEKPFEKILSNPSLSYSLIYTKVGKESTCLLMDRRLALSLIMQLYYFKGKGIDYFTPVILERNLTKRTELSVYKVEWDKFMDDLVNDPLLERIRNQDAK